MMLLYIQKYMMLLLAEGLVEAMHDQAWGEESKFAFLFPLFSSFLVDDEWVVTEGRNCSV
jgi:hypothetical protein